MYRVLSGCISVVDTYVCVSILAIGGGWSPRCRGWYGPVEITGFGAWWICRRVKRTICSERGGARTTT